MDRTLIGQYESGGARLKSAIAGLTPADFLWHPPAAAGIGLWSIQQVVLHLMDADLIWAVRMKTIIAEEDPVMAGYDEARFSQLLHYDQQDATRAAEIFDLNRRQFASVLLKLDDPAFARTGRHPELGPITLLFCVNRMVQHLDHHLKFIQQKRNVRGVAT